MFPLEEFSLIPFPIDPGTSSDRTVIPKETANRRRLVLFLSVKNPLYLASQASSSLPISPSSVSRLLTWHTPTRGLGLA